MSGDIDDAIKELIQSYQELNPSIVDQLHELPTALEFMRYVARNRPFVVRKGAVDWEACQKWGGLIYLPMAMDGQKVNAATTPFGNADAPLETEEHGLIFVKPLEEVKPFISVYQSIWAREGGRTTSGELDSVCYAQTQNDNLRSEYRRLFADVPASIPFARIALQKEPDAINFWMGNSHSTTALHRDPYENIYVQIVGKKHFVLLPPVEAPCVNEQVLPAATYVRRRVNGRPACVLQPKLDEPPATAPFATWDPDAPDIRPTKFSHLSRPYRVTLEPGDMLYLPALWYHKVKQSCGKEQICIAVNYWYDMDFSGGFHPTTSFVRTLGLAANREQDGTS